MALEEVAMTRVLGCAVGNLLRKSVGLRRCLAAAVRRGGNLREDVFERLFLLLHVVGSGCSGCFHAHHFAFAAAGWGGVELGNRIRSGKLVRRTGRAVLK